MLDDWLRQLESFDAEERKQAVIALGKSLDSEALAPLADVYRNDPDAEVRDLALKAGRHIKQHMSEDAGGGGALPPIAKTVSVADEGRAGGYIDQALEFSVRGNAAKAVEYLGRAFDINPNLRDDDMATNLAEDVTGLTGAAALRTIIDHSERADKIAALGGKPKRTGGAGRGAAAYKEVTWNDAILDLLIYGLVNGGMAFILFLVGVDAMVEMMRSQMRMQGQAFPSDFEDMFGMLSGGGVGLAAVIGVATLVFSVIYLIVIMLAVHVVATSIMGGEGTMPGLFKKTTLYFTITSVVLNLLNYLPFMFISDVDAAQQFQCLSSLISIGVVIYAGKLVGDAYDFGMGRGCVSLILGGLAVLLVFGCAIFGFFALLGGMAGSSTAF
jgi:hypothetical protein